MADTMITQNTDFFFWKILYIYIYSYTGKTGPVTGRVEAHRIVRRRGSHIF
jgi:hypothetical protein